jgi:exopolysaccharide biosynthesis polyprenyl glycosylphosphotransferase
MTDVGIRAAGLGHPDHVALERGGRSVRAGRPPSSSLLPWDLGLAACAAVALTVGWPIAPLAVVVLLLGCWAASLALTRASCVELIDSPTRQAGRVLRAGSAFAFFGSAVSIVPAASLTAGQVFAVAGALTVISYGVRLAATQRGQVGGCVVVVGAAEERRHAVTALSRRPWPAFDVVTVNLASDGQRSPTGEIAVPLGGLPEFARQVGAHSVVAMPGMGLSPLELRRLRWLLEEERLSYFVGTALVGVATDRLATVDVSGVPLVRIHSGPRSGLVWLLVEWWGRGLAALALALLSPILLALTLAIRWESSGPAVFRQTRIGRDGRPFTIFKLRTMMSEAIPETTLVSDGDGVLFKMRKDPRITPLGRWLRKYSLDELPQLLNVVLGQMRLVGPRPALPEEVAEYSEDERRRLAMPPGITGLWQVSGRSDLTWEEAVRLDLHYVDNWSPGLDLLILCRTVRAVVGHRGAY